MNARLNVSKAPTIGNGMLFQSWGFIDSMMNDGNLNSGCLIICSSKYAQLAIFYSIMSPPVLTTVELPKTLFYKSVPLYV